MIITNFAVFVNFVEEFNPGHISIFILGSSCWLSGALFEGYNKSTQVDQAPGTENSTALCKIGVWCELGSSHGENCTGNESLI